MALAIAIGVALVGMVIILAITPAIGKVVLQGHPERDKSKDHLITRWTRVLGCSACLLGGAVAYLLIQAAGR